MTTFFQLLPGMVSGLGVAMLIAAFAPATPRLAAAIERINSRPVIRSVSSTPDTLNDRIGGRLLSRFSGSSLLRLPEKDLRLIQMPANRFVTLKVLFAALGLILPFTIGLVFQVVGLAAFYVPGLFGIPLAVLGWFAPNLVVKTEAQQARVEFSRSVAVYIELVASERKRGAAPTQALENAAAVGKSWVFVRLRQELAESQYAGVAAWDGLERLAVEIDTPDLADLAKRMRLTGEEGASAYEALRAQGKSLRDRLLNDQHSEANKSTMLLQAPLAAVGLTFMAILATPFVMTALAL